MSRLKTRDERAFRVHLVFLCGGALFVIGALVWTAIDSGFAVEALIALAGTAGLWGVINWVLRWVDTGKWFR